MRTYLDHNATTPLRPEARDAMIAAMDVVGNPSSVHAEGRAAKSLMEKSRGAIATAFGADGADVIFTSSATEAASLALEGRDLAGSAVEHDAVRAWIREELPADQAGVVAIETPETSTLQLANSETGVIQKIPEGLAVCDATQAFGKLPVAFNWLGAEMAFVSAHKLGGPKGVGALVVKRGTDVNARLKGGGQEMGRRAGTENIIGVAGFAAAATAAVKELEEGVWKEVARLRDLLETTLADAAPDTIFMGQTSDRLPNTSCFAVPGWKGETQVMQMDLAGYAISAGSACSSGKVKASAVLTAMGYDATVASSAIRVSLGPNTREEEILGFADKWLAQLQKYRAKAA
ncbi:cysteine desulfurase family protein [Cognatishimia activa]|uniref:Cysteine desulfurase n=1 Tax=Cognatishimia activa TaxID=1715691 RepID=A0A0N7MC48_9RHOB|nr:cysteine desulfurase family protein [Cognatishimia activa]MEE2946209.1 cysteine desulfurase family protein [Pseudomonadota bacterium]CUJ30732.1 Cysteine desulfurase [Cognatishimia activa]CUK27208.1 Cysteine desulfurase [Cognatishimia activa]